VGKSNPRKFLFSENSAGSEYANPPYNPKRSVTGYPHVRILSPREHEVIRLLALGKTNKAISSVLGTSVKTVDSHRSKIMLKLNLDSLAGLVRYAILKKIVDL
jgi:DNA-binding NarL/FixJ family response regulator